jgi:hypothetical protein
MRGLGPFLHLFLFLSTRAARGFIVAGHHAPLAKLFVLLVLFLADLAPPFSFFIHLGLLPLTGLLPATALLAASAALLLLLIARPEWYSWV